jgi:DNA-directed RNA polymerase specialized sigma24 family protein
VVTEQQFTECVASHRASWHSAAVRLSNPDIAPDVVQSALARAWRLRDQWRGDCALSTWIHSIVRTQALETHRNLYHKRGEALPAMPDALKPFRVPATQDRDAMLARLRDAIDRLPPIYRAAIEAKLSDDMVNESWFKARVFRAMAMLRDELGVPQLPSAIKSYKHGNQSAQAASNLA